jgi:hypothetical protein
MIGKLYPIAGSKGRGFRKKPLIKKSNVTVKLSKIQFFAVISVKVLTL